MILSFALSSSIIPTLRLLARAANKAASLTRLAQSAPEKPGVPLAIGKTSTCLSIGTLCRCTLIFVLDHEYRAGHRADQASQCKAESSTQDGWRETTITPSLPSNHPSQLITG